MATKPNRTQAKQILPRVNSIQLRRAQNFDWSSNFTIDSVFELGNSGIVEDSVSLVESGITMNTNEWGTTDTEALLFGVYKERNIGKGDATGNTVATIQVVARGAGGSWSSTVSAGDWLQVHRFNAHPTTNSTEFVKVDTVAVMSGGVNEITLDETYKLDAPATWGDTVGLVNKYTITEDTIDSHPVHFVVPHRYSSTSTVVMHSVVLPRCYVDSLTYRFDTGGASEQNYSLLGEEERLLLGSRREVYSIAGSFVSYDTTGTLTFTIPRDSLAATASPYAVYANDNVIAVDVNNNVGAATIIHTGQCTIEATFSSGLGVDSSAQLIYYYTLPDSKKKGYKGITNITNGIGKLTKGYIEVYFGTSDLSEEELQRCTGVDMNVPLARESIEELGQSRSVAKPLEGNLRNEITLTFSRNDLREYATMVGERAAFDAGTIKEILMADLQAAKDIKILVKLYNSISTHTNDTLLKTFTFENCNFIGDSSTTPITGAAGLELQFSSETLSIVGSGNPPIFS